METIQLNLFLTPVPAVYCKVCKKELNVNMDDRFNGFYDKSRDSIVHFRCRDRYYMRIRKKILQDKTGKERQEIEYTEIPLTINFYNNHLKKFGL
jgi:hypothetical protein